VASGPASLPVEQTRRTGGADTSIPNDPTGNDGPPAHGDHERGTRGHDRYVQTLAVLFAVEWTALAISPRYRQDWALENVLTVAFVVALAVSRRWLRLSPTSCTALFLFLSLHTLGSHYTYAEVPYDDWARALTGRSISEVLGWERNHFDRFVHFAYGALLASPIREILVRFAGVRSLWSYYLPLAVTASTSADYELIEWVAALVFGGDLGMAYLGTQGDVWDAQKDMALAASGALLAMILLAIRDTWRGDARAGGLAGEASPGAKARGTVARARDDEPGARPAR
jgi:putative membrane protein